MSTKSKEDKVLAKLYKTGAKEAPPPKLDKKILKYAASKHKSKSNSYFSGGWKVPLSLAASITIVLAIIIQIQQMPDQTEIPHIPDSKPANNLPALVDELSEDADSRFKSKDALGPPGRKEDQLAPSKPSGKYKATKNIEQKSQQPTMVVEEESSIPENEMSVDEPAAGGVILQRTVSPELQSIQTPKESSMRKHQDKFNVDQKFDAANLPVGDWLLLIETLIAKKDYAEARRQIDKFKITHPKVNVDDLESKIP